MAISPSKPPKKVLHVLNTKTDTLQPLEASSLKQGITSLSQRIKKDRVKELPLEDTGMNRLIQSTTDVPDEVLHRQIQSNAQGTKDLGEGITTDETDEETRVTAEEAQIVLVYRYHSRGVSTEDIKQHLGLSKAEYSALYRKMMKYVRDKFLEHDILYSVGDSLHFYQDVRAACMQMASTKGMDIKTKMAAIQLAVRIEESKNTFMEQTGLYDKTILLPIAAEVVTSQLKKSQAWSKEDGIVGDLVNDMVNSLAQHAAEAKMTQQQAQQDLNDLIGIVPPISPEGISS